MIFVCINDFVLALSVKSHYFSPTSLVITKLLLYMVNLQTG